MPKFITDRTSRTRLLVIALIVGSASAAVGQEKRRSGNAVVRWNAVAMEILPVEAGPVIDSRAIAILHAAIHDAVNGIDRRYEPYAVDLECPGASLDAAVASAARDVLVATAPGQRERIEQVYASELANVPDGRAKEDGVRLGQQAARANLDRRAGDGVVPGPWPPTEGPITEPVYVPSGAPGDYAFTPPFDAPPLGPIALFPGWGRLPPFVIDLDRHRLDGPDPLTSDEYARDLDFLKSFGSLNSSTRTPDQTSTAFFWFESAGIWNNIAATVIREQRVDPWRSARTLALVNFALADAGIACFAAKYDFRFWRPYTAIRRAGEDGNDATEPDPGWLPLLWTPPGEPLMFSIPPIPDYPSAAAITSTAAAEVLSRHLGARVHFDATSPTLAGVTRHFHSFRQAADESAMSRVYGGIHFRRAVNDGRRAGKAIGRDVSRALPPVR